MEKLGYRVGAGAVIINTNKQILMFERIVDKGWQLPHGGLEDNESIIDCLFREVYEETGIKKDKLVLLSNTKEFIRHDVPDWHGQVQKWFLLEFTGTVDDINLNAFEQPVFSDFKWCSATEVIDAAIWFKKDMLRAVFAELGLGKVN